MFQYSFCSYSTLLLFFLPYFLRQFQYSFCSYSTDAPVTGKKKVGGFNTASVLIQHPCFKYSPTSSLFQYSFCSYSTQHLHLVVIIYLCFNTASVLIQQEHEQGINKALDCFNTASVLIQLSAPWRSGQVYLVSIQLLFLFNPV